MSVPQDNYDLDRGGDFSQTLYFDDKGVRIDIRGDTFISAIKAKISDPDSAVLHSFTFGAVFEDADNLDINGDPHWTVEQTLSRAKIATLPNTCCSDIFRIFPDTIRVPVSRSMHQVNPKVTP